MTINMAHNYLHPYRGAGQVEMRDESLLEPIASPLSLFRIDRVEDSFWNLLGGSERGGEKVKRSKVLTE